MIDAISDMTRKTSLETMGDSRPKSRRLATMRRAIMTMAAVNHGNRRTLSRPSKTTSKTRSPAKVRVQRTWLAEKSK